MKIGVVYLVFLRCPMEVVGVILVFSLINCIVKFFGCTASACYGNQPRGTMIAAASDTFWAGGTVCGKKYRVTCTGAAYAGIQNPCLGRSVVVKIVDHCPVGCTGSIDLSKEAFATIANLVAGIVKVTYDR